MCLFSPMLFHEDGCEHDIKWWGEHIYGGVPCIVQRPGEVITGWCSHKAGCRHPPETVGGQVKPTPPDFTATCIHHNTQWRLLLIWLKNCQVGPKGSKYMHTDCILPIVDYFTVKIFRAASCRFSILHMYIVTCRTYPTLYVRYWPVS